MHWEGQHGLVNTTTLSIVLFINKYQSRIKNNFTKLTYLVQKQFPEDSNVIKPCIRYCLKKEMCVFL